MRRRGGRDSERGARPGRRREWHALLLPGYSACPLPLCIAVRGHATRRLPPDPGAGDKERRSFVIKNRCRILITADPSLAVSLSHCHRGWAVAGRDTLNTPACSPWPRHKVDWRTDHGSALPGARLVLRSWLWRTAPGPGCSTASGSSPSGDTFSSSSRPSRPSRPATPGARLVLRSWLGLRQRVRASRGPASRV